MKRIVVGVDGSPHAENALHWAVAEAQRTGAAVEAVAAYATPARMYAMPMEAVVYTAVAPDEIAQATRDLLHQVVERVVGRRDIEVSEIVAEGSPAQVLRQTAQGADLLVVGTRGYGTVRGALVGSVTLRLLHEPPCPLVAVPLPDEHL